jgi:mRNA interferase HigB
MRIVARSTLRSFWEKPSCADSEGPLKAWFAEAERAKWSTPAEVKEQYGTASILKDGRVVFNIAGNKYRLVVHIHYASGVVFVRFVGTHREYDQIDAQTI